jgi:microcystin-dependent protein
MEPFLGEIRLFAGTFAPRGWAFCNGQLLSASQYEALFSLLGTTYGGDGRTTFGLPDMRGRLPIHHGQGPRLTRRPLGQKGGAESVTVTVNEMPSHSHQLTADNETASQTNPAGIQLARSQGDIYVESTAEVDMWAEAITDVGGDQSHNNVMPFLCLHFIIALTGIYPSRS